MIVLKVIVKILMFSIVVALTLIQQTRIFLKSTSEIILGILAFIFALTGIAGLAFGQASSQEAFKLITARFVIFMVPVIGEWFVGMINAGNARLRDFFRF